MDFASFCRQSHVLIVAGKGGVGKTTVSAALARAASRAGLSVLVIELEGKSGIATAFGRPERFGYEEELLSAGEAAEGRGDVRARTITPDDALVEYLAEHGLGRISKRLAASGALDVVATAAPGIRDILVLGKVKQLERSGDADLIVLDAPAAGHTLTFLSSAHGLLDAIRVGPIRVQAGDVVELLTDPARCRVLLVTLPEETPVNEVVETAFKLEDRVGISLGPVVVNCVYPHLEHLDEDPAGLLGAAGLGTGEAEVLRAAARFRQSRQRLQEEEMTRLADALPLPQIRLPQMFTTYIGPAETGQLAAALTEGVAALPARTPTSAAGGE